MCFKKAYLVCIKLKVLKGEKWMLNQDVEKIALGPRHYILTQYN
jgi:hypothetical protein